MIAELKIEDYPRIQNIWKESGLSCRPEGRDHPDRIKAQLETQNVFFLGAIEKGVLCGVVLVSHDTRKGWINRIAVLPQYQKRGIAKQLLNAAEDRLFQSFGIEVVSSLVFDDNEPSLTLFESTGYEVWANIKYLARRKNPDA